VLFTLAGFIHPIALLQMTILVSWLIVFVSCTGLYFSVRFKRTTTAVIMNFALIVVIWGLVPLLLVLLHEAAGLDQDVVEFYFNGNPIFQGLIVMHATANGWGHLDYDWIDFNLDAVESTLFMFGFMLFYVFIGWVFIRFAKRRMRRAVF
jgi:hypothetical protein